MELVDIVFLLICVIAFQAYQLWKLDKRADDIFDTVIGLHLGEIEIKEVDDNEY